MWHGSDPKGKARLVSVGCAKNDILSHQITQYQTCLKLRNSKIQPSSLLQLVSVGWARKDMLVHRNHTISRLLGTKEL